MRKKESQLKKASKRKQEFEPNYEASPDYSPAGSYGISSHNLGHNETMDFRKAMPYEEYRSAGIRHEEEDTLPNYSGKSPKYYQRSDESIREDICESLTWAAYIDASEIEVSVINQEVTLSGKVEDQQTKRLAEERIEKISGIKHIYNQLIIKKGDI